MPNTAAVSGYMPCSPSMHHKYSPCIFLCTSPFFESIQSASPCPQSRVFRCNLVLTSRRLAGLELIQVPATDSQTTLVLVHALAEALDIVCARTRLCHLSRRRASGLVLSGEFSVLRRGFGGGRGTASKPAADCVADGGSYCDTAVQKRVSQIILRSFWPKVLLCHVSSHDYVMATGVARHGFVMGEWSAA
ncbi:hypothetical protein IG631_21409 [Alternaria alternata]|nr:hypothetical protein IG631_21409 [Alternaria alternata]